MGERALEFFVAPRAPARDVSRAAVEHPVAAVLGAAQSVPPVASLLAAELRVRFKAGCVLLVEWRAAAGAPLSPASGVAARPARKLVERLAGRGLDGYAQGRCVRLPLPADPLAAAEAWRRAVAATDCPAVWAVAGARPAALDVLLGDLDLIVLVPGAVASAEQGELALAGLGASGALVVSGRAVPGGVARLLASSSIATSRLLGVNVAHAVRALA